MSEATSTAVDPLERDLRGRLGDALLEIEESRGQTIIRVPAERRPDALSALKSLGYTYFCFACAVDWPDQDKMEILDQVASYPGRARVTVKCDVPRATPKVPTATTVYAGADWYERETWELFGVQFDGHPRMRRLFLADWQEGFPMRKDEALRARVEKPWPGDFFSG